MYSLDACEATTYKISIKFDQLQTIEDRLAYYEKVSILFLLYGYENASLGYDLTVEFISGNRKATTSFLREWASTNDNWENILREALVIIQNYEVLESLGIDHRDECLRFLPRQSDCSIYIHPMLKILYHLCEDIDQETVKKITDDICKTVQLSEKWMFAEHFEIHLLYWIKLQIISLGFWKMKFRHAHDNSDISTLLIILKSLNLMKHYNLLKNVEHQINTTERQNQIIKKSSCDSPDLNSVVDRSILQDLFQSEMYRLDINNMGICLIIDEKEFNCDGNNQIRLNRNLETRNGTEKDSKRLHDLFLSYRYKVIMRYNLKDFEILEEVEKCSNNITAADCSFVVCILSHGQKDVVFGSNCVPVEINKINRLMRSKCMLNKPSMLIVQACQTLPDNSLEMKQNMETTNYSSNFLQDAEMPSLSDFLIYNSTVSGYASLRHNSDGSWFIQEICDVLDKYGEERNFYDLSLQINRNITQKTCMYKNKKCIMVPEIHCSFSKKFVLPKRNRNI